MTNFEKIKGMSVEELAKELNKFDGLTGEICSALDNCPYMDEDGNFANDVDCIGCIVKWLESEAESE